MSVIIRLRVINVRSSGRVLSKLKRYRKDSEEERLEVEF